MSQSDLEISLFRRDAGCDSASYGTELRFTDPTSEGDNRQGGTAAVRFDAARLRELSQDPAAYGQYLAGQLLAEPAVRGFFDQAVAASQAKDLPLRVRLAIAATAPELQDLRWETFRLPEAAAPLLTGQNLTFSRYLGSLDWRPVRLRPEADLAALVVVADPSDAARFGLAPVNREAELAAARAGLGDIPVTALATRGQATLNNIAKALREGYDVLYLVAHGMLVEGAPWLFLEKEDGAAERVPGQDLVTRIYELEDRPRLAVLVSCQSAGTGNAEPAAQDGGALAGLGPRLAEAGVPAVIAMQGNVTMKTAAAFMALFFQELRRDGLVDRAMSVARGAVRDRPDWWMPVLFMRLKSGHIGYKPGFSAQAGQLETWPALLRSVQRGKCTPIIGPGLDEWLLGSPREMAARWADKYGFAMDPNGRESLPQVAQYLRTIQGEFFVQDELVTDLRQQIVKRYGSLLAGNLEGMEIEELVKAVAALPQTDAGMLPYRAIAQLKAPIYFTTSPGNLLAEALTAAGRPPVVETFRWKELADAPPSVFETEPAYTPTPERPLVFHLFGSLGAPDSLVLAEDDYFRFLMGIRDNNDLIRPAVRRALTDATLLFLGFNLDDWDFRALFSSIAVRESSTLLSRYAQVAAQIDPEGGRIIEPESARRYLEKCFYFGGDSRLSIFWGSVADFGRELLKKLPTP